MNATTARVLLCFFLGGYAVFLCSHGSGIAVGADAAGYLNSARMLAGGRTTSEMRPIIGLDRRCPGPRCYDPAIFVPLGLTQSGDGTRLASSYPPGLPLHLAVAALLVGFERASPTLMVVVAMLALLCQFLLARELGLPHGWALLATIPVALHPITIFHFLQVMSDALSMSWCIASAYTALLASRRPNAAVLTGFCLGMAVLTRATSVLAIPALLCLLPWRRPTLVRWCLGGLPAAVFLAVYNTATYGSPLATGYGSMGAFFGGEMALAHGPGTLSYLAFWLCQMMGPIFLLVWAAAVLQRSWRSRLELGLVLWLASFVGFYIFYRPTSEHWSFLRFILPGLPALILTAVLALYGWSRQLWPWLSPRWPSLLAPAIAVVMVLCSAWAGVRQIRQTGMLDIVHQQRDYVDATTWMAERVPSGSAIYSMQMSGAIEFYAEYPIIYYDAVRPEVLAELARDLGEDGRHLYALGFSWEADIIKRHNPGAWTQVDTLGGTSLLTLRPDYPSAR